MATSNAPANNGGWGSEPPKVAAQTQKEVEPLTPSDRSMVEEDGYNTDDNTSQKTPLYDLQDAEMLEINAEDEIIEIYSGRFSLEGEEEKILELSVDGKFSDDSDVEMDWENIATDAS